MVANSTPNGRKQSAVSPADLISIRIELFGTPRLRAGCRQVDLLLPAQPTPEQVVGALGRACPALVGHALKDDLTDLQEGYVFNHNGTGFIDGPGLSFRPGDCLLLLSNQAGG